MADFCLQCSQMMGFESPDLDGLSTEEDTKNGLYAVALCESCGVIQVDHTGRCVTVGCLEKHNDTISRPTKSD